MTVVEDRMRDRAAAAPRRARGDWHVSTRGMRGRLSGALLYLPLIGWTAITLYPFAFILLMSVTPLSDLYTKPMGIPSKWAFYNYTDAWQEAQVPQLAINSVIVATLSTLVLLALAAPAAFALSRFDFRGKSLVWGFLLMGLFVPETTRLAPLAIITRDLGLYDTLDGLALVYVAGGLPFTVFLLASFMRELPRGLEEAAAIDGAGLFRRFRSIIFPLSRPVVVTVATLHVLYCWNEFLLGRLLLGDNRTLPMGMAMLFGQFSNNFPAFAAAMVMALIPAILVFVVLQRQVVSGMTAGAERG